MWPAEITKQLQEDEGFRAKPYKDTVGKLTIGFGRNLDDKGLSPSEAQDLLFNDIDAVHAWLISHLPWTLQLDQARLGVLTNMGFNMGVERLTEFRKMLAAAQAGDFETAANEMESSVWAQQVGARAHRLVLQMRTGVWQYAQPTL